MMSGELTFRQHERLSKIKAWLDKHETEPDLPFWFYAGETEYDEACSFCIDCIKAILPNADICEHYGGGYCCESDDATRCEKCGKLLQYTLTDYGVTNELERFVDSPPEKDELLEGNTCYELGRIAYGVGSKEETLKLIALLKGKKL